MPGPVITRSCWKWVEEVGEVVGAGAVSFRAGKGCLFPSGVPLVPVTRFPGAFPGPACRFSSFLAVRSSELSGC